MSEKRSIVKKERLQTWRQVSPGAQVMTPGSSVGYKTSDWAVRHMRWNSETCTHCLLCWATCPDLCINVEDNKLTGVDRFFCKGCGMCERICPTKPKSLSFEPFDGEEE